MNHDPNGLSDGLRRRVETAVGARIDTYRKPDCGLSAARRFSLTFTDGSRKFVKAATDDDTERWLRTEHQVLSTVGHLCMPHVLHWLNEPGTRPMMIVEDLSHAYWPAGHGGTNWREGDVGLLFDCIRELSDIQGPDGLPRLEDPKESKWQRIAASPEAFLGLGFCSAAWLRQHVDALIELELGLGLEGDCLVHGDIRSDNVCLFRDHAVFVDWSHAAIGNPAQNLASVLSTVHLEGGPPPFEIMPHGAGWAAHSSVRLVERLLGQGWEPEWLRRVFMRLIAIDLTWIAMRLGIEPPDGPPD